MQVGVNNYEVLLDGFNMLASLTGQAKESPRQDYLNFGDDTSLLGIRCNDWKFSFADQRAKPGIWELWCDPVPRHRPTTRSMPRSR